MKEKNKTLLDDLKKSYRYRTDRKMLLHRYI